MFKKGLKWVVMNENDFQEKNRISEEINFLNFYYSNITKTPNIQEINQLSIFLNRPSRAVTKWFINRQHNDTSNLNIIAQIAHFEQIKQN